ncbi:hypothetical protein CEY09_14710 [Achromobacter marplatensis]|nr:hypothetical protein CEY09_14710 [Achromobacter marplatensis]
MRRVHRNLQRDHRGRAVPARGTEGHPGGVHRGAAGRSGRNPAAHPEGRSRAWCVGSTWRRYAALTVLTLALAGCSKDPVSVSSTDNQGIPVAELFTHSGVTVFRFYDAGRWVYFTSKASDVTATHTEHCGKGCVRSVNVETREGEWLVQEDHDEH